jgi:hypothetical protein
MSEENKFEKLKVSWKINRSKYLLAVVSFLVGSFVTFIIYQYLPDYYRTKSIRPKVEADMYAVYTELFSIFDLIMKSHDRSPSAFQTEIRSGKLTKKDISHGLQNKCANESWLYDKNISKALMIIGDKIDKSTQSIDEHINSMFVFNSYLSSEEVLLFENIRNELRRYGYSSEMSASLATFRIGGKIFRPLNTSLSYRTNNFTALYELFIKLQSTVFKNSYMNRDLFLYKVLYYFHSEQYDECRSQILKHSEKFKDDALFCTFFKLICEYKLYRETALPLMNEFFKQKPYLISYRGLLKFIKDDYAVRNILSIYYTNDDLARLDQILQEEELSKKQFIENAKWLENYYKQKSKAAAGL